MEELLSRECRKIRDCSIFHVNDLEVFPLILHRIFLKTFAI
uniref:Uncharacterized protein n=1 Tax=Siphoviridae sp. ctOCb13 TaxID=2825477 RepID=A0A8S5Q1U0_9CAUD|nr:MAG TPA: hypothetical protein [Siphoviridae sp. ctOCb13]